MNTNHSRLKNIYRGASFLTSAAKLNQSPEDTGHEIAFVGRSNAGKSSAINVLCDQRSLARTSKTPGRTQLLNFFALDEERRLVDLPGYGFAKVREGIKRDWQGTLANYLETRQCLKGIIILVDIRHPLKDYDRQMIEWAGGMNLATHILLTKADKLKRGPAAAALLGIKRDIADINPEASIQLFSALKKQGIAEAHEKMNQWLEFSNRSELPLVD